MNSDFDLSSFRSYTGLGLYYYTFYLYFIRLQLGVYDA